jgi:very-short-patch-repair endonuclease
MDSAWSLRLINGPAIDKLLKRLGRSGRDGTVLMRKLRKERPNDWTPPASNLESRFDEVTAPHGFRFRRQVDIGDEEWSGRVDFLAEDLPLIVEILSERYHSSMTDRAADEARRARHTTMGFLVVEVWDHEIFHTPWLIIERIRAARTLLMAGSTR